MRRTLSPRTVSTTLFAWKTFHVGGEVHGLRLHERGFVVERCHEAPRRLDWSSWEVRALETGELVLSPDGSLLAVGSYHDDRIDLWPIRD